MGAEPQVDALLSLYRSLTPEQQSLFSSQQSTTSSPAVSPESSANMSPYSTASPSPQPASDSPLPSQLGTSRARARQVKNTAAGGKKRPLNAFMAFRSEYSTTTKIDNHSNQKSSKLLTSTHWHDAEDKIGSDAANVEC